MLAHIYNPGDLITFDYCGNNGVLHENLIGVIHAVRLIGPYRDPLYTVHLASGKIRTYYLENRAKCDMWVVNGVDTDTEVLILA